MQRTVDLSLNPLDPLVVYARGDGKGYTFITNVKVQRLLQSAAKKVYNIMDTRLRLWNCHYMRVRLCVSLFNSQNSPDKIQYILRCNSVTWRDYLHDYSSLSHSQLDGISAAASRLLNLKFETHCD